MRISNKMIHKELRFLGAVIKMFLRFKDEKTKRSLIKKLSGKSQKRLFVKNK